MSIFLVMSYDSILILNIAEGLFEVRTEMEVVFLGVSDEQEDKDEVPNSCAFPISIVKNAQLHTASGKDVRAADGFLPKYLRLYHPKRPPPVGSGAGPFGNLS